MRDKVFVSMLVFVLIMMMTSILYSQEEPEFVREFRIGPWDVLEVSVYGEANYTGIQATVNEYGRIRLPLLVEDVNVLGLSLGELENKLRKLFVEKDIFQNPSVTVVVVERQSQMVSVLGAVVNPGRYELRGRQKLFDIIAETGGFTTVDGQITLIREQFEPLQIYIRDLVSGEDRFNLPLQPKDIIYVRPEEIILIYVTGQVRIPGALQVPKSNIPTLYRAIIQAGGFSDRAAKGSVTIKRVDENGEEVIIKINVKDIEKNKIKDIQLQEGDIVNVPETLF